MVFTKFAQVGRIAVVNYGPLEGKPVMIVDIVDQSRALVDSPEILRQVVSFKRLSLLDILVKFPRAASSKIVTKVLKYAILTIICMVLIVIGLECRKDPRTIQ